MAWEYEDGTNSCGLAGTNMDCHWCEKYLEQKTRREDENCKLARMVGYSDNPSTPYERHCVDEIIYPDGSFAWWEVGVDMFNSLQEAIQNGYTMDFEWQKEEKNKVNNEIERSKNMIQNIDITKIHSHYNNPRKNLGDLTELAQSIKNSGILQNLTVVPWFSQITGVGADSPKQQEEMGYIAVIGHRRLAAAKLAGLTEVPCSISNMDLRQQVGTMLLENMQRSDLTIYEQAQGIQMMMDLGDTVGDISSKTGFSYTTVSRRVKLLEFDSDKFRKSVERGGTLMDYAELEKIHDVELRNKVLEKIGTPNFKWELQSAIDKEKSEVRLALIITELKKFATQVEDTKGLQYVKNYYNSKPEDITEPDDTDTKEYFFKVSNYGSIDLYKKTEISEKTFNSYVSDEKQKELRENQAALEEISKQAYQIRRSFILDYSSTRAKKCISIIIEYLLRGMLDGSYDLDYDDFSEALNIKIEEDAEWKFDDFAPKITAQPEQHLLIATYLAIESKREHYYNWNNQHYNNENLNMVYDFLEKLGYEMSEEEQSLRDGTHKLFQITNT